MLGVLSAGSGTRTAYAPSTEGALVEVAGAPAAERAVESLLAAGADDVVVDGASAAVAALLADRFPESVRDGADDADDAHPTHDRVVWLPTTAVVDPGALAAAARDAPAVLCRPSEPLAPIDGPEPRPVALPSDAFDGRPPSAAPAVAGALAAEDALRRLERDHVADVRRPWEYLDATEWCLAGTDGGDGVGFPGIDSATDGDVHPDAELSGPVVVPAGATVRSGAVIDGPVALAPGATVGPNCYVRANSFISNDTKIGAAVEIKNSVIMSGAKVPHQSYVGDSVVGPRANVGAGSIVANLRHDDAAVTLSHAGGRVSTGRRKFGTVIGADAKLGIGTRLNVGTVVDPGATTAPGEVVRRDKRRGDR
ncbi:glucose-1-phosphate thymidylyltransferase [Halobaculum lipolyticum]|uniref:Mannose-1-phosphate guanyltransferase C-terminal domain-containing protein n=1 Tax=Halobaculum lipolyticum TaxID=3032001 RepID=A0ABD5W629_9EURY|nr:glucose-1-phosphate thymidylyltransferase [Halobaculum sp. DT31]